MRPYALTFALLALSTTARAQGSDTCATAQAISGTGTFNFDLTASTTDGLPDALCLSFSQDNIINDVWFAWTVPADGIYGINTCGQTTLDTRIAVYSGTTCPTGSAILCNDDACGTLQSSVTLAGALAGQVYLIRIGLYPNTATTSGSGTFTIVQDGPVFNPLNGHWYQGVASPGITWDDARLAAESMSHMGLTGHLATLTDQAENDFVFALTDVNGSNDVDNFWIGGFQDLLSGSYSEPGGAWTWITGEAWTYTNWLVGEPNNTGAFPSEDFLELLQNFSGGDWWNDAHPMEHPRGYVVEYDDLGGNDFCNGDGGNQAGCTNCPCGNNAAAGTNGGCLNSALRSARLVRSGTPSASSDSLRIELTGGSSMAFGILTSGVDRLPTNMANPCFGLDSGVQSAFFDGLRCIGGTTIRHGSRATDVNGDIGATNNGWGPPSGPAGGLIAQGGFTAGQTRHFQVVYRENNTLGCLTGQNTSQGHSVTIQN